MVRTWHLADGCKDANSRGLGPPLPHLPWDLGSTPSTFASGLGPLCHRDWGSPRHICAREWACPCHIRTGTGLAARSSWTRMGFSCRCSSSRCSRVQPLLRYTCALPQRTSPKCEIHHKPATGGHLHGELCRRRPVLPLPATSKAASGVAPRRRGAARAAGGSDLRPACDGGDERAFDDVGPVRELRQGGRLVRACLRRLALTASPLLARPRGTVDMPHAVMVQRRPSSFVATSSVVVCCNVICCCPPLQRGCMLR